MCFQLQVSAARRPGTPHRRSRRGDDGLRALDSQARRACLGETAHQTLHLLLVQGTRSFVYHCAGGRLGSEVGRGRDEGQLVTMSQRQRSKGVIAGCWGGGREITGAAAGVRLFSGGIGVVHYRRRRTHIGTRSVFLLSVLASRLYEELMFCRPGCQFWLALTRCFRHPQPPSRGTLSSGHRVPAKVSSQLRNSKAAFQFTVTHHRLKARIPEHGTQQN